MIEGSGREKVHLKCAMSTQEREYVDERKPAKDKERGDGR